MAKVLVFPSKFWHVFVDFVYLIKKDFCYFAIIMCHLF